MPRRPGFSVAIFWGTKAENGTRFCSLLSPRVLAGGDGEGGERADSRLSPSTGWKRDLTCSLETLRLLRFTVLKADNITAKAPRRISHSGPFNHVFYFLRASPTDLNVLPLPVQVSWIRRRDLHVLTSGVHTFASDQRFLALHAERSENWTLQIR